MRYSLISSIILHIFIFLLTIVSLPLFNTPKLDIPPIIQVELIEIAEKTNVPEISKKQEEKEHTRPYRSINIPVTQKQREKQTITSY
mgnify:CR=1 FL=1